MKRLIYLIPILLFVGCRERTANPNPILAEKPPFGWNSFDSYGIYLHQEEALANPDILACNQNGQVGTLVSALDSIEIWMAQATATRLQGWIGVFNRSVESKNVALDRKTLGLAKQSDFGKPNSFRLESI